ncbi:unnamed protein product [Camellia sinensis]
MSSIASMDQPLLHRENTGVRRDIVCYSNAGIWSHITFRWLNPLFEKGQREKKLELSHIPLVPELETAEKAFSKLQESMQSLVITSLPRAIAHAIWKPLAINAAFAENLCGFFYMGPFLITHYVNSLSVNNDDASSYNHGLIIAFIFFIAKNMESVSQRQWYFGAQRVSVRIRAALMVLIYKKSLSIKLSQSGPINWRIVNLINADIEKIGELCLQVHQVWLLTVQVFLALIILYRSLGAAPSMKRYHSKITDVKDSRIKATSETFKSMRVLKLHSWESSFLKKLLGLRHTQSAVAFLFWASPVFVSAAIFGVCIALAKTPLTLGTIFPALSTFWFSKNPYTKVLLDRIREFIQEKDLEMPVNNANNTVSSFNFVIEIEKGEYSWATNSKNPTVRISNELKIMKGYNVAICGSVGSGKLSLLCNILGEIPRISGWGIQVYGSKAYVSQSAWIQTGTVRDNVLLGNKMDEELERGTKLSGGQKSGIQLARAIYSDSDVYFLDDPFNVVDALAGAHLFQTVVYVIHQLEFLYAADLVLVMRDGRIVQFGKYGELMEDPQGVLVRMMSSHKNSLKQVNPMAPNRKSCSYAQSEKWDSRSPNKHSCWITWAVEEPDRSSTNQSTLF